MISAVLFIAGITLLVFYERIAKLIVEDQNRWGFFHFGEKEIRGSQIAVIAVGIAAVIFSIFEFLK